MKRFAAGLAGVGIFLALPIGAASAMQIGASPTGATLAVAARTTISQPTAFVNGKSGRAYWLGVTFPDGTFFQAGYLDASYLYTDLCQTGFSSFVTGLSSSGANLFPSLYNNGNCNLTGSRTFKIAISGQTSTHITWQWYMSGNPIGPALQLPTSDSDFVHANAVAITEIIDINPIPPSGIAFPTVEYSPMIQFTEPGGSTWVDAANGRFVTTTDRTCYYALKLLADNDIETGVDTVINPVNCHANGDTLW